MWVVRATFDRPIWQNYHDYLIQLFDDKDQAQECADFYRKERASCEVYWDPRAKAYSGRDYAIKGEVR